MSWTDPCSNCSQHRADCDCGNWGSVEKCCVCETKEDVYVYPEVFGRLPSKMREKPTPEIFFYCKEHYPKDKAPALPVTEDEEPEESEHDRYWRLKEEEEEKYTCSCYALSEARNCDKKCIDPIW